MIHNPDPIGDTKDSKALEAKVNATTPEVDRFIQDGSEKMQAKILAKQKLTKADFAFMEEAKEWMEMSDDWKRKYKSVEAMKNCPGYAEAKKRHISILQWEDLLRLEWQVGEKKPGEWINEMLEFPGKGIIKIKNLSGISISKLPENMVIKDNLDLSDCAAITSLPENLEVGGNIILDHCEGLIRNKHKVLPHLFKLVMQKKIAGLSLIGWPLKRGDLPDGLAIQGGLILSECKELRSLPRGMSVFGSLLIPGCTGLSGLPDDLKVAGYLTLSRDMDEKILSDADELKKKGNILFEIDMEY